MLLEGGWNNAANADHTSGLVQFQGAGVQTFGEASNVTIQYVTMNKSSNDVTLTGNITVGTTLTMTSGDIVLGASNLTLLSTASLSGGVTASHINATSTGSIIQNIAGTGTNYTLPIGDGTNYTPYTFRLNSGTLAGANIALKLTDGNHPSWGTPTNYISRYWTLTPTGITGVINYDVTYRYVDADIVGTEASIIPWKYSGTTWTSGGSVTTATNLLSWSGVTSFSDYTGIDALAPLPIELLTFNALKNRDVVDVTWNTATEINNDYFTVERSKDAVTFEEVCKKDAAGNSTSLIHYDTIDHKPFNGLSYYRLKQTDYNGNYSYSQIVPVEFDDEMNTNFILYPNPNNGSNISLLVKELESQEEVEIKMRDVNSKIVYSKKITADANGNINMTLDHLNLVADGVYIVTLQASDKVFHKKLIIQ